MYEYETVETVRAILRRGRVKRENNVENEPSRVHCMHIWKVIMKPLYNSSALIKIFF
jgi:hypothetical protein